MKLITVNLSLFHRHPLPWARSRIFAPCQYEQERKNISGYEWGNRLHGDSYDPAGSGLRDHWHHHEDMGLCDQWRRSQGNRLLQPGQYQWCPAGSCGKRIPSLYRRYQGRIWRLCHRQFRWWIPLRAYSQPMCFVQYSHQVGSAYQESRCTWMWFYRHRTLRADRGERWALFYPKGGWS